MSMSQSPSIRCLIQDTLSLVSQMLGAVHGVNGRAAVLLRGAIVCGNIYFDLEKVLLDTGA